MKKEFNSNFEIKLDFEKEAKNPSRLFRSFAEMIEGINDLAFFFAQSVNTSVKSNTILDDIEKGSILGKFWNALVISEDGQIDNATGSKQIEKYIEESRDETLKFIADKKSSVEDLDNLKTTISEITDEKKLAETFSYPELGLLKLAHKINTINSSTEKLNKNV